MSDSNTTEHDLNDTRSQDYEKADELDDDFIPDGARPICTRCLKPCHPLQHYCDNCDSNDAINPLTPYMAFVNIRFNYGIFITMWRKTWYNRNTPTISRLLFVLMLVWFTPIFLIMGLPLLLFYKIFDAKSRKLSVITLFVTAIILLVFLVFYLLSVGRITAP